MTTFTWISETEDADWHNHDGHAAFLKLTVAELAERSGSHPDRVVQELRDWILNSRNPAYSCAWSQPAGPDAVVFIAKLTSCATRSS